MMTRRSLFSLLPAPLAGFAGLMTTAPEPTEAPDSDPLAEAALAVEDARSHLAAVPAMFDLMREGRDGLMTLAEVARFERRHTAYTLARVAEAEARLAPLLARLDGVAVVAGGEVYNSRSARRSALVRPVWVALLTPAEGGAS